MEVKQLSGSTFLGILYYLNKSRLDSSGECPIYLRITINGQRTSLSIKRSINPSSWSESGMPMGNSAAIKELKSYISAINAKLYEHHRILTERYSLITVEMVRDSFLGKIKTSSSQTILSVFDEHNEEKKQLLGKELSKSTYDKYLVCRDRLESFIKKEFGLNDFAVKDLNPAFINRFEHYLKTDKNCAHNTVFKYLQRFRQVVCKCISYGWLANDPFTYYKSTYKPVERGFLSEEELAILVSKEINIERLSLVRDMFVFSCFTGLAYCDVKDLKREHIQTSNEKYWIRTKRKKTGTSVNIPLLPPAMTIIKRYADLDKMPPEANLLPVLSNQKMNSYLKELSDICGITKNLTTHLARHTFATTVTLTNGVPIESVSKMLGHTNIRTTQHYAKIVDSKVGKDMDVLCDKLESKDFYTVNV